MITLVDDITGRKDFPLFKGSKEGICEWINLNLESIAILNEPHSCCATLEGEFIFISGDEDSRELKIINAEFIDLD